MKKMLLTVLLLLLLTGCGMPNLMGGTQEGDDPPEQPSVSVNDPEDETPETPEADRPEVRKPEIGTPEKPDAPAEPSSPAAPEADGEKPSVEKETGGSQQQETFDAARAVTVEAVDGGIQVVFDALPQTAEDIEALLEYYPLSDPRHAGAFFITSLVRYVDSADDGLAMIDVLRGPRPMNGMEQDFIKDRLRDKTYLPGAYFEGAAPENDYTPDTPWTLIVYDDTMEAEEGYRYIQVATTGADSRRRITLREKDGQYYLWEYSNILTGIRLPASLDPWSEGG